VSKTDIAFWLGLYASFIASITGLWALFRELWVERPRILVGAAEGWLVKVADVDKHLVVQGRNSAEGLENVVVMGDNVIAKTEILVVNLRNRGRRDATIERVQQVTPDGEHRFFGDLVPHLPKALPGESSERLLIGVEGDHPHGSIGVEGFYVIDGAGRIHPLRRRYRQRLSRIFHGAPPLPPPEPHELQEE
jgi:hypothetical protein